MFGDITLTATNTKQTKVVVERLAPTEKLAMMALLNRAANKRWAPADELKKLDVESSVEQVLHLQAPLDVVQKVLAKALKSGRKTVSAVRFANGKIEEVTESTIGLFFAQGTTVSEEPYRTPAVEPEPAPIVATTVAQPVLGCPAPDFDRADVRAGRVLSAFLNPDQRADFQLHQRFVAVGADTGHRYMLTSRYARDQLARYHRTLFDLDEGLPLCVHDWQVPAAEELLSLFVHLQLPGCETYVRAIPDREGVIA
jgi:hypothetical protein